MKTAPEEALDIMWSGGSPRAAFLDKGETYTNEGNIVMSAGAQSNRKHPSNNRALDDGLGKNTADWWLGQRLRSQLRSSRGSQGSLQVDGFCHPLAISQNPSLEGHAITIMTLSSKMGRWRARQTSDSGPGKKKKKR